MATVANYLLMLISFFYVSPIKKNPVCAMPNRCRQDRSKSVEDRCWGSRFPQTLIMLMLPLYPLEFLGSCAEALEKRGAATLAAARFRDSGVLEDRILSSQAWALPGLHSKQL